MIPIILAAFTPAAPPTPTISIDPVVDHTENTLVTFTGSYSVAAPMTMNYVFSLGGGSGALGSFTASGGTWSGTATTPNSVGSTTITVTGTGPNTGSDVSNSFALTTPGSAVTTFTLTNGAAGSVADPPWSLNLNLAKGDAPHLSYPAIYDHTNTLVPNQQLDYERNWTGGSLRRATVSIASPDSFDAYGGANQTRGYTVKTVAGTPSTTPLVTLADVQAQDIKLQFSQFDCGADTFQLRLNDILDAANNVGPGAYVATLHTNAGTASGAVLHFAALTATVTDADGGSLPFQVAVGMQVSGTNIPAGAYVQSISGSDITLSASVTGAVSSSAAIGFSHPVWGYEVIKSGPVCCEWKFWQFVRRVSDGAFHRWVRVDLFVKLWAATGQWEFVARPMQPNVYGPHPTGSVGTILATNGSSALPNASPQPRFSAQATLLNGATVLAHFGGPSDWTAFTLAASSLPAAGSQIGLTTYPVDTTGDRSFCGTAWAFNTTGGGTLPTGLSTNTPYWIAAIADNANPPNVVLCVSKYHAINIDGSFTPANWSAGASVAGDAGAYSYFRTADGKIWYALTDGTTGGTPPSGTGIVTTPDGIQWEAATIALSGGSGTITMFQVPVLYANTGWIGKDQFGSPIWWQGSGALAARPKLMLAPEFDYLTTKTTAVPPLNPSIATSPNNVGATVPLPTSLTFDVDRGAGINYYHSHQPNNAPPWGSRWNMSNYGDDPGDERVGPISFLQAWILLRPDSPILHQLVRTTSDSVASWPIWLINEQSGQMIAANCGPGRINSVGGSNYAGLGTTDPTIIQNQGGDGFWPTINSRRPDGIPPYLNAYGPYGPDSLHTPMLSYLPFLLDGDAGSWEIGAFLTNSLMMTAGGNATVIGSQVFGGVVTALKGNPRGCAWAMRVGANTEFATPDGHVLFHYMRDCSDDSGASFNAMYPAHAGSLSGDPGTNIAGQVAQGMIDEFNSSHGMPYGPYVVDAGPGFQLAMHSFIWAWLAWREKIDGRRTDFQTYLNGYMAPTINIFNGDYVANGSDYYAGPHDWAIGIAGRWFDSPTIAVQHNFPSSIYSSIPTTNIANNDSRKYDDGGSANNDYNWESPVSDPPGAYPWDTNNYSTMGLAAAAMLSWADFTGAQNMYDRLFARINSAPCQGVTWAQTNNAHYDGGQPATYAAWNYKSKAGN